jgi:hypothetical protein
MSITTRTRLLRSAGAAALALTCGAVETASAADSVERATKLLEDKRLTVYIPNRKRTGSDIQHKRLLPSRARDHRNHRRRGIPQRGRGRWRVESAQIRRGVGWANVRFDPGTDTARVVIDRRGVRILGHRAQVSRSPRC